MLVFSDRDHDRLGSFLTARGFRDIKLTVPPLELCTDNAAMIAWTGMEMYENGWESDLRCRALRKVGILSDLYYLPFPLHPCSSPKRYLRSRSTGVVPRSCRRRSQVYIQTMKMLTQKFNSGQWTQIQKMEGFWVWTVGKNGGNLDLGIAHQI